MNFAWQLVPRYHPQISIWDVLCAMVGREKELLLPLQGLELEKEESHLFWLNSATAGLNVMLRALNLPAGSGVGVPIYTCVAVFEAVAAAGLRCVFVDIDPENFSFDLDSLRRKRKEMATAVMIHTFGFPGNITAIKEVLGDRPIIEDCSHALGSTDSGQQVGLRGAAGVFSFNCNKPLSAGGGGLLIINSRQYVASVKKVLQQALELRRLSRSKLVANRILKVVLYRRPWYGLAVAAGMLGLRRDGVLQAQVDVEPASRFDKNLLRRNLKRLKFRWDKQRAWACEITELAGNLLPAYRFVSAGELWNGYIWPVLLHTHSQRETSLDYFHKRNVDAFVLWPECLRTASRFGYQDGECPRLEDALQRLLMLPCYAELTNSQRRRIREAIRTWRLG